MVQDAPVIRTVERQQLEDLAFDEVVVALPAWRHPQLPSVIDSLSALGKPIRAVFDLGPRLSLREKLFQAGRLQMMNLGISPVESFAYTVVKRAFDLMVAIVGFVALSPMLLVISILVKLSSAGP